MRIIILLICIMIMIMGISYYRNNLGRGSVCLNEPRTIEQIVIFFKSNPIFADIIEKHILRLQNLDKVNPPFLILFSGTPGMGKTTIAKKLEHELSAVCITLDEVRIALKSHEMYPLAGSEQDKTSYIIAYAMQLILALQKKTNNQLIILDASVDRVYPQVCQIAAKYNYPLFVIRIKASKETAMRRIKSRGKYPTRHLQYIDRWYKDYLKFDSKYVDYVVENDKDETELEVDRLIDAIKVTYKI